MSLGGYEDGYAACPCFWGRIPGSYIDKILTEVPNLNGWTVLDAGCGEGKNAFALANKGAKVLAIDCSVTALNNGQREFTHEGIEWRQADILEESLADKEFDLVIAYGLLHCMKNEGEIRRVVEAFQACTRVGGYNVICAFNGRSQDLTAHPGFLPCLISHEQYLEMYSGWEILSVSDSDLTEIHPHNGIEHTHSMTRILVRRR